MKPEKSDLQKRDVPQGWVDAQFAFSTKKDLRLNSNYMQRIEHVPGRPDPAGKTQGISRRGQ